MIARRAYKTPAMIMIRLLHNSNNSRRATVACAALRIKGLPVRVVTRPFRRTGERDLEPAVVAEDADCGAAAGKG